MNSQSSIYGKSYSRDASPVPAHSTPGNAFRHGPPALPAWLVLRARLLPTLRDRFERPLTVIVAGPGFGKTTLLAQAIAENRIERLGTDVWLRVEDQDRVLPHLIAGISRSLTGDEEAAQSVGALIELVWAKAPEPIAIFIDDVHLLDHGDDTTAALRDLLAGLPGNGHLVLSSRTMPPLPIAKLQSRGDAVVLRESDLAFGAPELAEFADHVGAPPTVAAHLPNWPALATLTSQVGHDASIEYLWDEILNALPDARRRTLAALVPFTVIDDELLHAVAPTSAWSASALVAGLPLIETDDAGSFRLHDLWVAALQGTISVSERKLALIAGAGALLERGEHLRAGEAFATAGDTAGLLQVVRRYAAQPLASGMSTSDVVALQELMPVSTRSGPLGQYLAAAHMWAADDHSALAAFERARAAADKMGDSALASMAWWRIMQLRSQQAHIDMALEPSLLRLAEEDWPLARSAVALARSIGAQEHGDIGAALACLADFDRHDPVVHAAALAARTLALGRPEMVPVTLESALAAGVDDLYEAMALWWRGDVSPEVAWPIGVQFRDRYAHKRLTGMQVALTGMVAQIGLAAGAVVEARRFADEALAAAPRTAARTALFAGVADALVTLVELGEDEAAARFRKLLDVIPIGAWPAWAYWGALAPLRVLAFDAETLDGLDVGPSLRVAVDAGRAVTELRRTSVPGAATGLPWDSPDLLRAHVPAPMLCELAVAVVGEVPAAATLIDAIPGRARWIRKLLDHPNAIVRDNARSLVRRHPPRPDYDIRIVTLGAFAVERTDGRPVEGWDRRERVRALLAGLVLRRSVNRADLAAAMWPDLSAEKAGNNLRVNLHHLQQALQPDRSPDDSPWFVAHTGDQLRLAAAGVTVDVDELDGHMRDALAAERRGLPSQALASYEAACELYSGDFLPGLDQESVENERTRLRSVAHGALCRRGELVLARGEPEIALALAAAAQRVDEMSERAARLAIRCHLAVGSTSAACSVARRVADALADARIEPDPETRGLLGRLAATV